MTLTFDLLIFNIYHTWRVTWTTLPPSWKTLRVFFHELRVITFPIDYHWKCVRRPFCFMQIIRWKLIIRLGNRAHRIQHASIMPERLVPHFYSKMHLDDYWRPFFRNPSRLYSIVQNLVGIDAVVSIMWKLLYFARSAWKRLSISCPQSWVLLLSRLLRVY